MRARACVRRGGRVWLSTEVTRGGKPVARLVSMEHAVSRVLGQDQDLFKVPDDFDAPLPDDLLGAFES